MPRIHEYFLFTLHKLCFSILNLFDLSLQLNGYPIKKAKQVLKNVQAQSESDFEHYLERTKHDIVSYHLEHNPFYKTLAKNANPLDWNSVPILTKRDFQHPLAERLSSGFNLKKVYVNKTSGSSGDPFIFAKDKFCHAMTWAVIENRFGWYSLDFNKSRQARFYGIPLDKKGYYKELIKDKLSRRTRFSVFDMTDITFENHLNTFRSIRFDYINGYTSAVVQFAKYLERKQLVLTSICPTLKACFVTSEMLFEKDKNLMETQFGVPVLNEYGASELDLIAFENPNSEWQINSETLYVEVLDEQSQPLPLGKEGRIVITSLYNKAHPFIRYDIGDVGALSKESTSKKPILQKLIGRTNDIVVLPSGKKAAGLTFYYITKSIIEDDGNVKEFVVHQLTLDTFKIIYVSDDDLSEDKIKQIKAEMEAYLEKGLNIIFERQDRLKRSKSGKLKQFSSLIQNKP